MSFILTSEAHQMFYVADHDDEKQSIVLLTNQFYDNEKQECENINTKDDHFIQTSFDIGLIIDDILYTKNDHNEWISINPTFCENKKK